MRRLLLAAAVLLTAGCSQTAALAPVGGNHLTIVRFAAIDVLVAQGVSVLVAPVCDTAGDAVTCQGSTVDGATVTVRSDDPTHVTVTVAERVLYDGLIQDVLDSAARPTG